MVSQDKLHIIAVTAFIERDGKYLILKRSEDEIVKPGMWTLPGGKVERGESLTASIEREVKEETGLEVEGNIEYVGNSEFTRPDDYHVIIVRFKAKVKAGEVKVPKEDFTDYAWISLDELDKYELIGGVKKDFEELKQGVKCLNQ
ncbi:TPA: NUDIX hydrolase [candidate division CPR2 bacterium]|uniref:Putative hydrolase n=1 Tax=candidate division CPR2 bacterium GW2011_GWC1_41_48 TaxID=1618344 RepID=A0A0G0Z6U3_UNCC2|nr:MAG: putative hydrolase [candidate division CPR2 bacterium GW2011_GWC2_39_35]KKR28467.1 MAG: putative hydrolase [candidate division CPR2 bacterium GW2011_GWD2_39_7]KKS08738.1 MAG: putative hydrolase [candidate division CPR2 bacterium GW2011_GWC1_41_48]OGB72735.1 MAG: hypothetical protein A2Y26_04650 [candidate division CPR2 bacterium GWD2_39_7]HBG81225.1 NUDIX hydrolase [candidate division CPR2 bacterium]